jgi:hypothetical protein
MLLTVLWSYPDHLVWRSSPQHSEFLLIFTCCLAHLMPSARSLRVFDQSSKLSFFQQARGSPMVESTSLSNWGIPNLVKDDILIKQRGLSSCSEWSGAVLPTLSSLGPKDLCRHLWIQITMNVGLETGHEGMMSFWDSSGCPSRGPIQVNEPTRDLSPYITNLLPSEKK